MLVLWVEARAVPPPDAVEGLKANAAEVLEVKVLEAQQGQGERFEVRYRMEVLSVLRSASRVHEGETIRVRSYGLSSEALARGFVGPKVPALLAPGWIGTAYLKRDREASGPDANRQFAIAAQGDSFIEPPPAPPSLRWTPGAPAGGQ
jgi:hypothetical protein